jgi:hypothetical protein
MPRKNNIQLRKGSSSEWVSADPVLASGEPGFDLNNNILKIGDGSKHWNQLNPIGGGDLSVLSEEPNGFVNKDHSAISVNFSNVGSIGSGIFTISPTGGVSSYDVFIKGLKYNYGSLTGYIPDSTDLYFVYIDKSDQILKVKNTNPNFATDIPVSYVYWNTDNNQVVYQAEERHGIKMDSATHLYLHRVFGAQYISGLGLTYNSLIGNGSTDIDAKIAISDGLIFDEDDQINISHSSNPNINNYEQILSPTGQIPIFYKDGAAGGWKYSGPTNYPVKTGTSAQYNQYTGGSWTTTNAGNAKFVATWIVATNNMLYPIIGIMGQEVDDNIGQADTDNLWENLDLTDLPVVEMRPLYRLIFETDGRWTGNSSRVALRDVKDIRSVLNVTGGGLSPSDHGNLFGLLDDDHPQYVHIDNSRTIGAVHTFTNGLISNGIGWFGSDDNSIGVGLSDVASGVFGSPSGFGAVQGYDASVGSYNPLCFTAGYFPQIYLDTNGNVGIDTATPTYKLEVNGGFAASTKSFRINHPSKKGYSLEYGSLESPYHGVRLTGRDKLIKGVGTVSLPDYLKDLIHDDDTLNIQITNIKHGKTIYIYKIDLQNDRFIVKADRAKSLGELQFCWTLSGVRKDVDHLVVEKRN